MAETIGRGLEDIVIAESDICYLEGQEGVLAYRGYNIHDLAGKASFEEVVYLLWYGKLPTAKELDAFNEAVKAAQDLPAPVLAAVRAMPKEATPMEVLRTGVSLMSMYDPEDQLMTLEANQHKAIRLLARMSGVVGAFARLRDGKEPVSPNPNFGIAKNFLYMLQGTPPSDADAKVLDTCLTLHADHEFNASTFAARVTAATLSDLYSSITAAISALKGPLHGGANEQVMRMLVDIGSADNVEPYLDKAFAEKRKIMGFGHRVYKTEDPRATHLRKFSEEVGKRAGNTKWFEMSQKVEKKVKAEKGLNCNVDFYSASTYYTLGIPIDLFTPVFAISRVSGWVAHVLEQYANNRLIRPRAQYVGSTHVDFVPIDKR